MCDREREREQLNGEDKEGEMEGEFHTQNFKKSKNFKSHCFLFHVMCFLADGSEILPLSAQSTWCLSISTYLIGAGIVWHMLSYNGQSMAALPLLSLYNWPILDGCPDFPLLNMMYAVMKNTILNTFSGGKSHFMFFF